MRESGGGRLDTWVTLVPVVVLVSVSIALAGSPSDLVTLLVRQASGAATAVWTWFVTTF